MSEAEDVISAEAAEKAYEAAAANAAVVAPAEPAPAESPAAESPAPLDFPPKAARAAVPEPAKPAAVKKLVSAKKPAVVKKAAKPLKKATAPKAKVMPLAKPAKIKPATPPSAKSSKPAPSKSLFAIKPVKFIKETIMPAKKTTAEFTKTVKAAAADVQAKAKLAYAKGTEVFGEATDFAKGNVEAVVTSGKILGAGFKELGKTYADEGKAAVETMTADVKKLSEVKSPVDFLQTQSAILRRNFDHAIEFNSKTGESMINLFGSAFAPISARASLVVEKVKKAA